MSPTLVRALVPALVPALQVKGLTVSRVSLPCVRPLVSDVSLELYRGELVGLVGESGSGKSLTSLAIMSMLPPGTKRVSGSVVFDARELTTMSATALRTVRGRKISMVLQEPRRAMNPMLTIGGHFIETMRTHLGCTRRQARLEASELLRLVGIERPVEQLASYPFELSGGMLQRAAIALALSCQPEVLLADEPTTALDVTVQAKVLELIVRLTDELGLATLLVSHNLAVVANSCDRVVVMLGGEVVEEGPVRSVITTPSHPYTSALINSVPDSTRRRPLMSPSAMGTTLMPVTQNTSNDQLDIVTDSGCYFRARCDHAHDKCSTAPPLVVTKDTTAARCHLVTSGVS